MSGIAPRTPAPQSCGARTFSPAFLECPHRPSQVPVALTYAVIVMGEMHDGSGKQDIQCSAGRHDRKTAAHITAAPITVALTIVAPNINTAAPTTDTAALTTAAPTTAAPTIYDCAHDGCVHYGCGTTCCGCKQVGHWQKNYVKRSEYLRGFNKLIKKLNKAGPDPSVPLPLF